MSDFILIVIFLVGFTIFKIIWTVTDNRPFMERLREGYSPRLILYLLIAIQLLAPIVTGQPFLRWPATPFDYIFITLGVVLFWIGCLFAFWGKLSMKDSWGVPGQHQIERQNKLVISGAFKVSRNPIYAGLFLALFGLFLALRSYLMVSLVVCFYYLYKAVVKEEDLLEKYFGQSYLEYKEKVKRFWVI